LVALHRVKTAEDPVVDVGADRVLQARDAVTAGSAQGAGFVGFPHRLDGRREPPVRIDGRGSAERVRENGFRRERVLQQMLARRLQDIRQ
jgi:hypothetical protein